MTLPNRVDPFAEIHAVPSRGQMMGNRGGCFHRPDQTLKARKWASRQWICCQLEFKGRTRKLMQPGQYTELFFLDEATALSAGHRPCFECRRPDALRFTDALMDAGRFGKRPRVAGLDAEIALVIQKRLSGFAEPDDCTPSQVPDGTMISANGRACLKWGDGMFPWSFDGYGKPEPLPDTALCLSPDLVVSAFRAGYVPGLHSSME